MLGCKDTETQDISLLYFSGVEMINAALNRAVKLMDSWTGPSEHRLLRSVGFFGNGPKMSAEVISEGLILYRRRT